MTSITPDILGTEGSGSTGIQLPQASGAIGEFIIGVSGIGAPGTSAESTSSPNIIPSYLYLQYSDDDDIRAFVDSYNALAQYYLSWFNSIGLPIYTGPLIFGALLDWVAQGIYGISRPTIPSGIGQVQGPLGTYAPGDMVPLGELIITGPPNYYVTNDDIFKRILTWHFFKGDGKYFSIEWLKRRIMRFLLGDSGTSPNIDQAYRISVTFGTGNQVNITIIDSITTSLGGEIPGMTAVGNGGPLGVITTTTMSLPGIPYAQNLKDAIDYGVLELPWQYTYVVTI